MVNRRGSVGLWLFISFIVLAIAVVLLVIFLHGADPSSPVSVNVSVVSFFNVSVVLSDVVGVSPVSYVLSNISFDSRGGFDGASCINVSNLYIQGYTFNGSDVMGCPMVGKWIRGGVLVSGLFFPNTLEFYRQGVVANSTVLLEAFSDSYYFNSTVCNVSSELFSCRLSLLKKANDYSLSLNSSLLTINITDGNIQKPQICVAYPYIVSNVILANLSEIPIIPSLHWQYDICWNVSHDLSNTTNFVVDIHKNPFFDDKSVLPISFILRDFEVEGHQNIGDRIIYKNISFTNNMTYTVN